MPLHPREPPPSRSQTPQDKAAAAHPGKDTEQRQTGVSMTDQTTRHETWADDGNHGWGFPRTWVGRILDTLAYKLWGAK